MADRHYDGRRHAHGRCIMIRLPIMLPVDFFRLEKNKTFFKQKQCETLTFTVYTERMQLI